jgi:hypothetical protein
LASRRAATQDAPVELAVEGTLGSLRSIERTKDAVIVSREIEERLERIERKLDQLLARLGGASAASGAGPSSGSVRAASPPASAGGEVASDADLDSARGNPEVRFSPKRWSGADMKGRRYSECEPEFLDMLADALDWFAQRDDESGAVDKNGNPKSKWGRLDASRARGWSRRLRGERGDGMGAPVMARSTSASAGGRGTSAGSSARPAVRKPATMDDLDAMGDEMDAESIPF